MYNLPMEKKNKKLLLNLDMLCNLKLKKEKIAVEPIDTDVNRFLLTNGI